MKHFIVCAFILVCPFTFGFPADIETTSIPYDEEHASEDVSNPNGINMTAKYEEEKEYQDDGQKDITDFEIEDTTPKIQVNESLETKGNQNSIKNTSNKYTKQNNKIGLPDKLKQSQIYVKISSNSTSVVNGSISKHVTNTSRTYTQMACYKRNKLGIDEQQNCTENEVQSYVSNSFLTSTEPNGNIKNVINTKNSPETDTTTENGAMKTAPCQNSSAQNATKNDEVTVETTTYSSEGTHNVTTKDESTLNFTTEGNVPNCLADFFLNLTRTHGDKNQVTSRTSVRIKDYPNCKSDGPMNSNTNSKCNSNEEEQSVIIAPTLELHVPLNIDIVHTPNDQEHSKLWQLPRPNYNLPLHIKRFEYDSQPTDYEDRLPYQEEVYSNPVIHRQYWLPNYEDFHHKIDDDYNRVATPEEFDHKDYSHNKVY